MSTVSFEIVKNADRLFFHDGEKYVLFDSGFVKSQWGKNSVSVDGKIGPFEVERIGQSFLNEFINMKMNDGEEILAVFNPMDGFNCLLEGNTLTISDEELEHSAKGFFFSFVDSNLPIIEGKINGKEGRFFFDSGARMTMFGEESLAEEKIKTYREWMAMIHEYADLSVYKVSMEFPNGFKYEGEGALVTHSLYRMMGAFMNIKGMLGIDIFKRFNILITAKGKKRGIELFAKE